MSSFSLPMLSFVLGGANSGKSRFAENLVVSSGCPRVYIATAQPWDGEMKLKISEHQSSRGSDWQTIEAPLDVAPALASATKDQVVLLDCATMWLTNHLLAEHDLAAQQTALLLALSKCAAPVVVVSNEVGLGIVPDNALSRQFRTEQGRLNHAIAAQADLAVFVAAGLPLILKGTLPTAQS